MAGMDYKELNFNQLRQDDTCNKYNIYLNTNVMKIFRCPEN